MTAFPTLLSPLHRGRLKLKNRVIFPAHQTLFSEDSVVGPRMRAYYVERAKGGAGAVAFASGIAAQHAALFTLLEPGDHVVASSALYGGSVNQFKHVLRKMNVGVTWVDPDDLDAFAAPTGWRVLDIWDPAALAARYVADGRRVYPAMAVARLVRP